MGREIARTASHPTCQFLITNPKRQFRSDCVPIALDDDEWPSDSGIFLAYVIAQQHRTVANTREYCIRRPIVVPISDRQPTRQIALCKCGSCLRTHIFEDGVAHSV